MRWPAHEAARRSAPQQKWLHDQTSNVGWEERGCRNVDGQAGTCVLRVLIGPCLMKGCMD